MKVFQFLLRMKNNFSVKLFGSFQDEPENKKIEQLKIQHYVAWDIC